MGEVRKTGTGDFKIRLYLLFGGPAKQAEQHTKHREK